MRETDPYGMGVHDIGAKLDAGKNRLGLVIGSFSRAIQAIGEVGTYGATKYSRNSWLYVPDGIARYTDAMYRHLMKEHEGEETDKDTEMLHAAHAAWNALARLELILRAMEEKERDN